MLDRVLVVRERAAYSDEVAVVRVGVASEFTWHIHNHLQDCFSSSISCWR
jgi:hypothetical protein